METERKQAEAAPRKSEGQLRLIIDALPSLIAYVDTEQRYRFNNMAYENWFQCSREEIYGQHVREVLGEPAYQASREYLEQALAGRAVSYEARMPSKTGGTRYTSTTLVPDVAEQGEVRGCVVLVNEITERKRSEQAWRESEEHFRLLVDGVRDYAILTLDMEERINSWNPGAERLFGYSEAEVIGESFDLLFTPKDQAVGMPEAEIEQAEATGRGDDERWHVRKDGSRFYASGAVTPIHDEAGQLRGFVKIAHDVTERKLADEALKDSEVFNRSLMEGSADCIKVLDADGKLLFMNGPGMCLMEIDDFTPFIGRPWAELWPGGARAEPIAAVTEALDGAVGRFQGLCPTAKGTPKWWDVVVTPVRNAEGEIVRLLSVARDITASKQIEERLVYLANYDALTGLPNRALLMDRLNQALAGAVRHKRSVAVLFLDLDGFKHLNDTLGHNVGDQLLSAVAKRLIAGVRASDTVARFGGDEFVLILTDVARAADANRVARKILEVLSQPLELAGNELFITTSIGISLYPRDGDDPSTLLKSADSAMYLAKKGRNRYRHHSPAMSVRASKRLALERDLRRALARDEFVLHYQPQIDLTSGRIDTVEVLLRWRRPESDELVPPLEFIPLAEESGLIVPIGEWVLRAASAQIQAWRVHGLATVRIAVNVSAHQFHRKNMKKMIDHILKQTGLDHSCLELELTESILHTEEAERILPALRKSGIKIAIDDFGTGFSSLSYLKRFPVHKLKIDRSFTRKIPAHADNAAISTAIIAMAHSLGLEVTAEGVETPEQLAFLRELRCDGAQGYLLSKPLPAEDLGRFLAGRGQDARRTDMAR